MNFSIALNMCKAGKSIRRKGWNGADQFIYYVPAGKYPASTKVAKEAFGGELVPYRAYLAIKTVQGDVVPWLASQSDLLEDDWELYFKKVYKPIVRGELPRPIDFGWLAEVCDKPTDEPNILRGGLSLECKKSVKEQNVFGGLNPSSAPEHSYKVLVGDEALKFLENLIFNKK